MYLSQTEIEEIVKTLGNIAKNNLSHAIVLDHAVLESRIISDTIEKGLLKPFDNENISKKFTAYIPFYG